MRPEGQARLDTLCVHHDHLVNLGAVTPRAKLDLLCLILDPLPPTAISQVIRTSSGPGTVPEEREGCQVFPHLLTQLLGKLLCLMDWLPGTCPWAEDLSTVLLTAS